MTRPAKLGVRFGLSCILPVLAFLPAYPVMAQQEMEEVVVTGSYIKRDSFDSASPLTVVSQDDIAANATPNLGEVLVNQTFNYGTDYQTNTYATRGQGGNTSNANLRGLGTSATLQLIDGKRTVYSNLNNKMPQIAIDRIDILRDGAAALYGTDAVAGVVNLIPRKSFTGVELSVFRADGDDIDENAYEFIMGSETDNGHITVAGAYRTRGQLQQTERPKFIRAPGDQISGTGNPGRWVVPVRDATGAINPAVTTASGQIGTVTRDPGCGVSNGPGGTDPGKKFNRRSGVPFGSLCLLNFGEWWNYMNPNTQWSLWSNFRYAFSDELENELDIMVTELETDSRGSAQNPGGRTEEFPIVLGDHPGNPYRAMADRGGGLEPLYAQDLFDVVGNPGADGIPDRAITGGGQDCGSYGQDCVDVNLDGIPDVILAPVDPFDSANGIDFNEDVDVVALRAFGKLGCLEGHKPTQINDDCSNTGNSTFTTLTVRAYDQLTYQVPDSSWEVTGWGLYEVRKTDIEDKNTSQSALINGLNGTLIVDPADPTGRYWNPFSTQQLECVNRACTDAPGTEGFANTVSVLDAINIQSMNIEREEAFQFELMGTGDLVELPNGAMVSAAFGATYRRVQWDDNVDNSENSCDWHQGGCDFDWVEDQDYYSVFYEFFVPVIDQIDVSLAGAYVDYGGSIGSSFDPKFAVMFRPLDVLSVRASWSSAFVAPTLPQQYAPVSCGLQSGQDKLLQDTVGTFRATCFGGNPNLENETATTWNVGASASLLEGDLNVGVDYAVYDFEDRISITTFNQILDANFFAFEAAGGDVNNPVDVQNWIANNECDCIHRDTTNVVTRVDTSYVNAQKMKHKAWDFYGRYTIPFDAFGTFTAGLSATYVDEYSYDLGSVFGQPLPSGDGAGKQNDDVAEVPPTPAWRLNGTVNWLYGNHAAQFRLRRYSQFELNTVKGYQGVAEQATYIDLQYGYQFVDILGSGREARLEVGVRNLTDHFPHKVLDILGGIETYLHDIRGRMVYGRLNVSL